MFNFILPSILTYTVLLSATISSTSAATVCLPCQIAYSNLWYPGLPRREVHAPHITSPSTGTKWKAGSSETVTWDTTGIPRGTRCRVLLGYLEDGSTNEHLQVNNPLASPDLCDLSLGRVNITIPAYTEPRNNYIIVVIGDSGNRSEKFTIEK